MNSHLVQFLSLGKQPLANAFLNTPNPENEYFYELAVGFDPDTKLVSLMKQPQGELMFNEQYPYRSSGSRTMRDHFRETARYLQKTYDPGSVLEIGSNDGVFLKEWHNKCILGIEPCKNFAEETSQNNLRTLNAWWNKETADNAVNTVGGTFDLIYAANCMCHIPDIQEAFNSVAHALSGGGIFVFEDPYIKDIVVKLSYDQIYDEHAHLFSITALKNLLKNAGLQLLEVQPLTVHGGSNRVIATKSSRILLEHELVTKMLHKEKDLGLDDLAQYKRFAELVEDSRDVLHEIIADAKARNKKIISYGATSKSTTIFNYCNLDTDSIDYIVDITPAKQGTYSPGMHIPIISPEEGMKDDVDLAFLGAWNFEREIMYKEKSFLDRGGKFISHVPFPRVLS